MRASHEQPQTDSTYPPASNIWLELGWAALELGRAATALELGWAAAALERGWVA